MKAHKTTGAERHATLLNAAARVSRNVASILDLNTLLNRTVDIICEEFGFYYAGVFLVDESGSWASLAAGRGEPGRQMIAEGHKLQIGGNSMVGTAIANRAGRIALDVGKEAIFFKNPHLPQTRSEMALPLVAGEEVIGALTVQSEVEAAFKDEDIAALQTMADQLGVAIANARLHRMNQDLLRQTERRLRLMHAANNVGREVTSLLELDQLLPRMVDTVVEAYGFYYAGVFLVDESGEWAHLRAGYGEAGEAMLAEGHKLKVGGTSMIGTCTQLGEARIALDVGEERIHFRNPHLPNTRSEMALPLRFGKRILGAVTIQSVEEQAFTDDDVTTLQTMADHLAVAIQNAYALEELKAANAELLRTKVFEALTAATTEAIHWIGNKAMPISMTVARLQEELAAGQPDLASLQEDLALIAESATQIIQVKEQLIGQGREQKPRPVLLEDILNVAARRRGMENVKVEINPEATYVIADSTQLVRALGNLLQNAAEAGAKTIAVEAAPAAEKGRVRILLTDDGMGMSPEVLEKLWSPFFTTKVGHHGLGLPAARHVISQFDGCISVDSRPGKGTNVEITLPTGHLLLGELGKAPAFNLVDDDDAWSRYLAWTVGTVARTDKPDLESELIVLDEDFSGLEKAVAAITKAGLAGKTVIVTAALDVDRMTTLLHWGFKDVKLKPYSPAEIPALWEK